MRDLLVAGLLGLGLATGVQARSEPRTAEGIGESIPSPKATQKLRMDRWKEERDRREQRDWDERKKQEPPLQVTLDAPASGAVFASPATIELSASAEATRRWPISRVEFYANGELLGTSTSAPFAFTWTGVAAGTYTLFARAYANNPGSGKSREREPTREGHLRMWTVSSIPVQVTVTAAKKALYFIHADHLGTPRMVADENQKIVWRWDQAEPFGNNPANEDPDGDGIAFDLPLRLPGQYYDRESGLHYNYFRDYDPSIGRYEESDPIGLRAGLNTYAYVRGEPLRFVDVLGLDVRICFFPLAASGFGHVGIGIAGAPFTHGFYPNSGASVSQMFRGTPGIVAQDPRDPNTLTGATCQIIPATRNQDNCISRCIERRAGNPGTYKLLSRQCTSFARDCLTECVLPSGNQNTPYPDTWYQSLPGGAQFPYFPTPNVPVPSTPFF